MLENPFLYSLAMTLVHFLWQGLLVACIVKFLYIFISNKNSQVRYALATLAMLVNLLLPIATFALIYQTDFTLLSQNKEATSTIVTGISRVATTEFSENLAEYFPYIALLWLITVAYLSLKLLYDIRYVSRLTKTGITAATTTLNKRFIALAKQLKLPVMPKLLISVKAEIPMAIGWLKPVVLLPASMLSGLTPAQLEMLLLHELAHIKRYDYLVNFMQTLVEILLFFHPAVHWVSTQMRNEREYCSDDIAVHHCRQPIAYARALTETAALCQKHAHSIPQMALAASGGDLKQRVIRLVDSHCTSNNDVSKWFAGLFIIISLLAITSKQALTLATFENSFSYLPFTTSTTEVTNSVTNNTQQSITNSSLADHLLQQESSFSLATNKNNTVNLTATKQYKNPVTTAEVEAMVILPTVKNALSRASLTVNESTNNTVLQTITTHNNINAAEDSREATKPITREPLNKVSRQSKNATQHKQTFVEKSLKPAPQASMFTQYQSPKNPYAQQIAALAASTSTNDANETTNAYATNTTAKAQDHKKNAQLITSYPPKYPSIAKRNKVELEILVHFTIDTHGFVRNIEFDQQGKANYFKRAIRNAMKKWRFEPATINGEAVESQMSKIFSFSLED